MTTIHGFNYDKEKLAILLDLYVNGNLDQEQSLELQYMLEQDRQKALKEGNLDRAREMADILKGLKWYMTHIVNIVENTPITGNVGIKVIKKKEST